jgi:PAS domain S-box-containing protein
MNSANKLSQKSSEPYKILFQSINEALAICEIILDGCGKPYDYRCLEVNPAFERIVGIPVVQIRDKTWREIGYGDPAWIEMFGEVALTGEPVFGEYLLPEYNSWIDLKVFSLGGMRLAILFSDITTRKRTEESLEVKQEELSTANGELQVQQDKLIVLNRELQAQTEELNCAYRDLQKLTDAIREYAETANHAYQEAERRASELDATIAAIAAGVVIYDNSGEIIRINDFALHVLGGSSEAISLVNQEQPGARFKQYKAEGSLYKLKETPLYRALHGEVIRDEEMFIAEKNENPLWLSVTLAPIFDNNHRSTGVILIFTDITQRKRKMEDRLASERELLNVTLNSLGEGVVTMDKDERIIFINQAAAKLTGYSQEEAIGKPVNKIIYILDDITSEPIEKISSQAVFSYPILVTRDLREIAVSVTSSPIKDMDGRIIGTVIVIQDTSEKQKVEQNMLKTAKLESLGILAGGVAHDFNNILAGILANLQLAATKLKRHEDITKYLEATAGITRKASELTKQLLTFAKGGDPVRKSTSIIELIKDTVQFILSGSKVRAEFHLPENLWVVDVDEGQITQAINNITINAEQAMPIGGVLQIYGENVTIEGAGQYTPGRYIKLTIKDHGIGIPEEYINKIFDPFFTTKKTGNGLGLSTTYSIIKKHNGYLEVKSAPGIGTTFYIFLPASKAQLTLKKAKREIIVNEKAKILLMDDEDTIRNVGGEMLTYFGYQVSLAGDGQEAIKLYKEAKDSGEPFDVVVMDLTIPGGLGGIETISVLRKIDPEIKAIITSGYAGDVVMSEYKRYGFSGVVTKPYRIDELNEVLMKVIDKKQLPLNFTY